jgi:hypothetical protein
VARIIHPDTRLVLRGQRDLSAGVLGVFGADGNMVEVPPTGIIIDRDPIALGSRGLYLPGAQVNMARNPRGIMSAAIPTDWGGTGPISGITRTWLGSTTIEGIPCNLCRFEGTATEDRTFNITLTANNLANGVPAVQGETWTASFFAKVVEGSAEGLLSPQIGIFERNAAAGSLGGESAPAPLSGAPMRTQRATLTRTIQGATTAFFIIQWSGTFPVGVPLNFVLAIGSQRAAPGADPGPIVLPPPATIAAAVTGAEDVEGLDPAAWWNATAGTFSVTADLGPGDGSARGLFRVNDGTPNELLQIRLGPASSAATVVSGGVTTNASGPPATSGVVRATCSYGPAGLAFSLNGGAPSVAPLPAIPPISRLLLGRLGAPGTIPLGGWLRRFRFRPAQLLGSDLASF